MVPTEDEPPLTTRTFPSGSTPWIDGYGRPSAGVGTPGRASPGIVTERAQTAASSANGTTTPSVNGMLSGRMAAFSAGMTV